MVSCVRYNNIIDNVNSTMWNSVNGALVIAEIVARIHTFCVINVELLPTLTKLVDLGRVVAY